MCCPSESDRAGWAKSTRLKTQNCTAGSHSNFCPRICPWIEAAYSQIIREARAASSLNHPNIVTVYEIIQTHWGLAIVMELVEGQSLRALLKSRQLSRQQAIQIGRHIASALAAAHQKSIVHRDIKPENIMVRVDGYVKVLDFGLAQNIRERALGGRAAHLPVGTVRYMAPEQKSGAEVTGASDVYSLALVLEELGKWRHPLLTQMRSAAPEQRPSAEKVAVQLERLRDPTTIFFWRLACFFCWLLEAFCCSDPPTKFGGCRNHASSRSPSMQQVTM